MTRDEAVAFAPIIKAYSEGKTIQYVGEDGKWHDFACIDVVFCDNPEEYRIKPEAKYRPFKDAQECWDEMLKHQPFGWVKAGNQLLQIVGVDENVMFCDYDDNVQLLSQRFAMDAFDFADGTPFGIEEGGEQ